MTIDEYSQPSFAAAYAIARPLAAKGDTTAATERLCRLLWHVEADNGGFVGLSDEQLWEKCESDSRLDYAIATQAMWNPGAWPRP